jgi:KDO2-lipid IV(A) lauroyltransferase
MMRGLWRGLRANLVRLVLPVVSGVLGVLPLGGAQGVGKGLGALAWWASRRDRQRAIDHLAIAYPELPAAEHRKIARACFRHLGMTAAECFHLMRKDCAAVGQYAEVSGWENIEAARSAGQAVMIVTGHCGNWELLAAVISCGGLDMAVIAREANEPKLSTPIVKLRQRFGTETISRARAGASRRLLQTLRDGRALGMLIDQDTRVKGVWVPFFGRPAFTPVGAAEIALRRNVAVIPSFIERRADGSHLATFHPALELGEDSVEATARMTETIEAQIRRVPEQWVWMHRRWRRQPPDDAPIPYTPPH